MGGHYNYISSQSLVNFSRAPCPRAERTRLFGLIDTQKYAKQGTAVPPLPAHRRLTYAVNVKVDMFTLIICTFGTSRWRENLSSGDN
jgi:hypothetical protein